MSIRHQENDHALILRATHSQLEFPIWQAGFRLSRGDRTLLHSGPTWGAPISKLNLWSVDGDRAILTYHRGTHGLGRLMVTALEDGWQFAWDQLTRDTFTLSSGGDWYGQGELIYQPWPLNDMSQWEGPLMTWDNGPTGLGDILSPMWLTSTGVALYVEKASESLHVGFNAPPTSQPSPVWNLDAVPTLRPLRDTPGATGMLTLTDTHTPLTYSILVGLDMPSAYRRYVQRVGKPDRIPPEGLIRAPIWTTWARYKTNIDEHTVLSFATEIRKNNFQGGTLEIDDKWQCNYGDTAFDPARFPDPATMVRQLNELGFAVTVWIIPFMVEQSPNTLEAIANRFLVRQADGSPYKVRWWQGEAYLLDVSNPYALAWFADKLGALQKQAGLAGYKFDAGEGNFLPADAQTYQPMNRNEYSTRWVEFAAKHFPYCEVRCGWNSQRQPVLFREWDKFSTWGLENGLASVVTTALSLSLAGYPFVLPDMIGGNAYFGVTADKELLVRWTQASAPMLAIQFSLAPWDFDAEAVAICRKYAQLHVDLAEDRLKFARQATLTGDPVIRPMFWHSPRDTVTFSISDQYMLGDQYVVAPVIQQGAVSRDVYLPAGQWRDYWTGTIYEGGHWLKEFPAPLEVLPLFERV